MNSLNPSYPGQGSHPSFGDDAVTGEIRVHERYVTFQTEGARVEMPLHDLQVTMGGDDGEYVVFEHPREPNWAFWTSDSGILRATPLAARPAVRHQVEAVLAAREGQPLVVKVTLGLAAFVLLGVLILWSQSDNLLRAFVSQIPPAWEQEIGSQAIEELRAESVFLTNEPALAFITAIGKAVEKGVGTRPVPFRYYLVEDRTANAYALPGGHIVIHSGLLEQLSNAEELAGVLAHEMAHVTERHGIRSVAEAAGPVFALSAFLGKDSALADVAAASAYIGLQRFSREHEREADDRAFDFLARARVDPRGLITFFKKDEDASSESLLSSHPATRERITNMERRWERQSQKAGFIRLPPIPTFN